MPQTKIKAEMVTGDVSSADAVSYDNSTSGLAAENVEAALDEVVVSIAANASDISDNTTDIATNASDIADLTDGTTPAGNATKWGGAAYTVSTSDPSGGADGDFWFKYTA